MASCLIAAYLGGLAIIWILHWIHPGNEWDESDCRFECCYIETSSTSKHPVMRLIISLVYPVYLLVAGCLEIFFTITIKLDIRRQGL